LFSTEKIHFLILFCAARRQPVSLHGYCTRPRETRLPTQFFTAL